MKGFTFLFNRLLMLIVSAVLVFPGCRQAPAQDESSGQMGGRRQAVSDTVAAEMDMADPFSSKAIAESLEIPVNQARKMTYTLRKMGAIKYVGKNRNQMLFTCAQKTN